MSEVSNKKIERICPCGTSFFIYQSQLKGHIEWGRFCSKKCRGKYSNTVFQHGHEPYGFKKEGVSYIRLHIWLSNKKKKTGICQHCGHNFKRTEWANKSHEYKRDLDDYIELCRKCHVLYDINSGKYGVATKKFNLINNKYRVKGR